MCPGFTQALLSLSSWCLVMVMWLFFAMPLVCLRFVIVGFPDHTHFFERYLKMEVFLENKISFEKCWKPVLMLEITCILLIYLELSSV